MRGGTRPKRSSPPTMSEQMLRQIEDHGRVIDSLRKQVPLLQTMADRILQTFRDGGRVYLLGNGGSAADAQHIAAELLGRYKRDRRPLPAVALTTDSSTLTAITNDLGGQHVFVRQVEALATDRDVVWALSVSGSSRNVLSAMESARRIGACRFGFTGRNGQRLRTLCDYCFVADHESADRVQEAHVLAYHLICDRVEAAVESR